MTNPPTVTSPYFGRDARFYKGTVVIANSTTLSLKASAALIKIRSNDSLQPLKTKVGEQTFTWSAEHLFAGKEFLNSLISGEEFDIVFGPDGTDSGADMETWKNCHITGVERKNADGVLETVSGEAQSIEFPTTPPA